MRGAGKFYAFIPSRESEYDTQWLVKREGNLCLGIHVDSEFSQTILADSRVVTCSCSVEFIRSKDKTHFTCAIHSQRTVLYHPHDKIQHWQCFSGNVYCRLMPLECHICTSLIWQWKSLQNTSFHTQCKLLCNTGFCIDGFKSSIQRGNTE